MYENITSTNTKQCTKYIYFVLCRCHRLAENYHLTDGIPVLTVRLYYIQFVLHSTHWVHNHTIESINHTIDSITIEYIASRSLKSDYRIIVVYKTNYVHSIRHRWRSLAIENESSRRGTPQVGEGLQQSIKIYIFMCNFFKNKYQFNFFCSNIK